ncbi:MAG: CrcB family protein [Elusimicrobia bacterium]|nr:CrcB family protein [Elusimicrobiota bacterium]
MDKWTSLAAGTLAGGVARYVLAGLVYQALDARFPHGTLAVNLSGCFLIGALNALAESKFLLGPNARVLLMTGFCGAFTTLSTLLLETSNLLKDGEAARAFVNVAATLLFGFLLLRLGELLGEVL